MKIRKFLISSYSDQIYLWNMSTNPTNLSPNLAGVLYFGIFFKKLYLLYIGTEGVYFIFGERGNQSADNLKCFFPFGILSRK
jgi:hypothetical protein